jgi:putative nucleotidyltransferase with HDIG domain
VEADEVMEVIPEFALIEDGELRAKCLQVWAGELEKYGYSATDLASIPFTALVRDNPISLAAHMRSLAKQCSACADLMNEDYDGAISIDKDVLIAAALMHDVGKIGGMEKVGGKFTESRREKLLHHSFSGVGILMSAGFPDDVVHAVALHSKDGEGRRKTAEAVLLHHLDFMNYEPLDLRK